MKLWISENESIEVGKESDILTTEFAPRSRSFDWMGLTGFLPDPDPVLRRLGMDLEVYRQLLTDAHVWSCYESRTSGTLSCEWEIREAESGGSARANKQAKELITDVVSGLDIYQVITDMLDAPFFGMSPIEVIWTVNQNKWVPERVVGKPPEWFVFSEDNELRFRSRENMTEGEEIPQYKFLCPRHRASYKNPYGERILSRCFWPVTFKKGGFKFWAIFTEKYGMPWVVGKVPRNTNENERKDLLSKLVSIVQDAAAVINNDESVEITQAEGKQASSGIFEQLISAGNRECSKAILGQTLSTELDKGGSYAATQGHLEVRQDLVDADKRMVKSAFNQLFRWITELNVAGAAPPLFAFYEEEDVQKDRAERDKSLSDQGVRFTKEYYKRIYNLEDGDLEIKALEEMGNARIFAENRDDNRFSQDDLDNLSTQGAIEAQDAVSTLLAPVSTMIENAETFEEIGEKIYELYPDMDSKDFQQLLARAMFAAGLTGYAASKAEENA